MTCLLLICGKRHVLSYGGTMQKHILKNGFLEVQYLDDSLRIIGLALTGKTNLLADLNDLPPIQTPYGAFHFRGGHRL